MMANKRREHDRACRCDRADAGCPALGVIRETVSVSQELKAEVDSRQAWHRSICTGIAASLVVVEELIKLAVRQRDRQRLAPATRLSVSEA
jgi:hypothetical protein